MRSLLNTLYVTTQGSYLSRDGETVLIRVEKETKLRIPIHTLGGIVCFGQVSCSPPLMELCGERNVAISFLSEQGRFYARIQGPVSGNVLLRREQYRRADDLNTSADVARMIVMGKVANCRALLLRAGRDYPDSDDAPAIEAAAGRLGQLINDLRKRQPLEQVRGMESDGARTYFGVFDHLIHPRRMGVSFASGLAVRRSTISTPCFLLCIRCSCMMFQQRWKRSAWTRPWVLFIEIDLADRVSLST